MSTAKRLAWIAAGYALCVVAGFAAVTVNELRMPADVAQGSPGMVAFGDMILFVLVAGFVGLVPTWFLLKLLIEKAPRALVAVAILVAVLGPVSWLAVRQHGRRLEPPEPACARQPTARPVHRLRRHSTHGLWPGLAGDRGSSLPSGP